MEKIHCSVPILTLNRAKELERCMESIKEFSDIIIIDGNSIDETREIAKKYGARIYFQDESVKMPVIITDFTAARKKAWSYIKEDWIFHLDSNEWLDSELVEEVRRAVEENNSNKVYFARRINVVDGKVIKHAFYYPKYFARLVNRKSGAHWREGKKVHERLDIPAGMEIIHTKGVVYKASVSGTEDAKKIKYYLNLEFQRIKDGPKTWYQFFYWVLYFNLRILIGILFKSIWVYLRYGFKDSLPPVEVWGYARYHLILIWGGSKIVLKHKMRL